MKAFLSQLLLALICILGASTARASAPVVDSLWIDEGSSHIFLRGQFGAFPGSILVGTRSLTITNWTPALIEAEIPVSGDGSAGPISVLTAEGASKTLTLTMWTTVVTGEAWHDYSNGASDDAEFHFRLYWRACLSIVRMDSLVVQTTRVSEDNEVFHHYAAVVRREAGDVNYTKIYHASAEVSVLLTLKHHAISFGTFYPTLAHEIMPFDATLNNIGVDSNYSPSSWGEPDASGSSGNSTRVDSSAIFFPPTRLEAVIEDHDPQLSAVVLANPVHETLKLRLTSSTRSVGAIKLFDICGREVISLPAHSSPEGSIFEMDSRTLGPGVYNYRFSSVSGEAVGRFVVF